MSETLLPCPLCGSTDIVCFAEECGDGYDNVPTFRAVVGCRGCHEEGCDEPEWTLYTTIHDAIARYKRGESGPTYDRDALLALADNLDSSASMLLKQNDLDPNRKRRGMRRDHAKSLMAASDRIREVCGERAQ